MRRAFGKILQLLFQMINKRRYKIAVIGGYHGGNLGDMALGITTQKEAEKSGYRSALQVIYSLNSLPFPKIEYAILGGGAIGYSDSLKNVIDRYPDHRKVAILGVDFNESYDKSIIEFLKNVVWISCRSETQRKKLMKITGRDDIVVQPDIVFSLDADFCKKQRNTPKQKKLLINLVPLYGSVVNGRMIPNEVYKKERPELYDHYDRMIENYIRGIRTVAERYIRGGYQIETIPFTSEDAAFSKIALSDITVTHHQYHSNPYKMLKKMATAEKIFATRYHATILAAKVGAGMIPMAYARKNEYLLDELGVPRTVYLTSDDLANGIFNFPESITVEDDLISQWEDRSRRYIFECIHALV